MKNIVWTAVAGAALATSAGAQSIVDPSTGLPTSAIGGGASTIGVPSLGANGLGMPTLSPLPSVGAIGVPNVAEPFDGCPFSLQVLCLSTGASGAPSIGAGSLLGVGESPGLEGLVPGVINVPPMGVPLTGGAPGTAGIGGVGAATGASPGSGLLDFLLTPSPLDPFGTTPSSPSVGASQAVGTAPLSGTVPIGGTAPIAPGAGGAPSSAGSAFGGSSPFDQLFCRPEDPACF